MQKENADTPEDVTKRSVGFMKVNHKLAHAYFLLKQVNRMFVNRLGLRFDANDEAISIGPL